MDYYASYKNSKDPALLRKELVSYALTYGNKKAARHFQTTIRKGPCKKNCVNG